jgi:uncharacterized protein YoxC
MPVVQLNTLTNVAILVMAAAQILLCLAIVFGVIYIMKKLPDMVKGVVNDALDKTLPKVQPMLDNATHITGQVSEIVEKVSPRVVQIADESEDTVHSVTAKVKSTSNLVTENVARPIVNIASLLTGVQKGLEVWQTAKTTQGDGNGVKEVTVAETLEPSLRS